MFSFYSDKEKIGRDYLTDFLTKNGISYIYNTTGTFDPVDVYSFIPSGERAAYEIKVRDPKYLNYSDHILQKDKYEGMLQDMKKYDVSHGYYANFFGSDVLYLYDISIVEELNIQPEISQYRISNETYDTRAKYVYKLPSSVAFKFKKDSEGNWKVFS